MNINEPLHLVVDMRQDLMDGDITFRLLWDISDGDEPAQIVDGVYVTQETAPMLLQDYVSAWERAWLATAEAMGYDAIAAGGSSPEAHEHIRRNTPEALDRSDIGVSAVDAAMETVWNHCPTVTLAEVAPTLETLLQAIAAALDALNDDEQATVIDLVRRWAGDALDALDALDDEEQAMTIDMIRRLVGEVLDDLATLDDDAQ